MYDLKGTHHIKTIVASIFVLFLFTGEVYAEYPPDSLRIRWMEGKKYILHKVEAQETLSALSRRYDVSVKDIRSANIGIRELKEGQIINIPAKSAFSRETKSVENVAERTPSKVPVYYTVKPGETMYGISRNFNVTVDEIKTMNSMTSHDLNPGQRLIVGYQQSSEVVSRTDFNEKETKVHAAASTTPDVELEYQLPGSQAAEMETPLIEYAEVKKSSDGKTLVQVTETGAASWIQDAQFGENKYYALHRTAPIGTIIKLTNRMNSVSVYVKVVGVLPDTSENQNIIIKVSQSVTNRLNALDPVFQAELTYGIYK
jgi:LysM repeat protein